MKKLIIAFIGIGLVASAATLSRVQIGVFNPSEARVLNNVIDEAETAITATDSTATALALTVGTNTADIAANGVLIATNTLDIAANAVAIAANTESITTASLTNGATLTATSDVYVISGIGGADDTTNTVTLANAVNGQRLTLVVAAASTNLITIADSGNVALSGAWLGDANDVISLIGVSTNWVQTSESDN